MDISFPPSLSPAEIRTLLAGPAGTPPPGIVSDLSRPNPKLLSTIVELTLTAALSTVAVALRICIQHFLSAGLVAEDFVLLIALAFQIATSVAGILSAEYGIGKHIWDLSLHDYVRTAKMAYIYLNLYIPCIAFVKVAIVLQYIRIFTPSRINEKMWYACWATIIIIAVFYATYEFLQIFRCIPVEAHWEVFMDGKCTDSAALNKACGIFNIVSDLVLLLLPIPTICNLKLKTKRKVATIMIFTTGIFACATSVIRTCYTWRVFSSGDSTYYEWSMGLWCVIEILVGVIIFCLPVYPQLYHSVGRRIWSLPIASHSSTLEEGPAFVETALPKATREPYGLPSLTSFEESEVFPTAPTVDHSTYLETKSESPSSTASPG